MAVGPMREYAIIKHAQTLERELLKAQAERDEARRELQLLLESTKVETCAEPLPERDGEPADFAGAITRMRLAEAERDQWRIQCERAEMALQDIATGTSCRECGGEDQARLAKDVIKTSSNL